MARYTCLFTVATSVNDLQQVLLNLLQECHFDIIYQTDDYLMAREIPGQVAFSKLVTVEILIDRTMATEREVRMKFVIKNEELPLQVENHCKQMFNTVLQAVSDNSEIRLIETVAG